MTEMNKQMKQKIDLIYWFTNQLGYPGNDWYKQKLIIKISYDIKLE